MKEKPLCGYCYNECTDECCDKRRIDVLERQLKEDRIDLLKDTRELLRQLDEAREENERLRELGLKLLNLVLS